MCVHAPTSCVCVCRCVRLNLMRLYIYLSVFVSYLFHDTGWMDTSYKQTMLHNGLGLDNVVCSQSGFVCDGAVHCDDLIRKC